MNDFEAAMQEGEWCSMKRSPVDVTLSVWAAACGTRFARTINVEAWQQWADGHILQMAEPPHWLLDLSLAVTAEQVQAAIHRGYLWKSSQPQSPERRELDSTTVFLGLLYLRHLRGGIDAARLLWKAGEWADIDDYRIRRKTFRLLLNEARKRGRFVPSDQPVEERIAELFAPLAA